MADHRKFTMPYCRSRNSYFNPTLTARIVFCLTSDVTNNVVQIWDGPFALSGSELSILLCAEAFTLLQSRMRTEGDHSFSLVLPCPTSTSSNSPFLMIGSRTITNIFCRKRYWLKLEPEFALGRSLVSPSYQAVRRKLVLKTFHHHILVYCLVRTSFLPHHSVFKMDLVSRDDGRRL